MYHTYANTYLVLFYTFTRYKYYKLEIKKFGQDHIGKSKETSVNPRSSDSQSNSISFRSTSKTSHSAISYVQGEQGKDGDFNCER